MKNKISLLVRDSENADPIALKNIAVDNGDSLDNCLFVCASELTTLYGIFLNCLGFNEIAVSDIESIIENLVDENGNCRYETIVMDMFVNTNEQVPALIEKMRQYDVHWILDVKAEVDGEVNELVKHVDYCLCVPAGAKQETPDAV